MVIPLQSSILIPVKANFPEGFDQLYVEKIFNTPRNPEDVYAPPDTIISKSAATIHVANFSSSPITIEQGQPLGTGHNPRYWLDNPAKVGDPLRTQVEAHAHLI